MRRVLATLALAALCVGGAPAAPTATVATIDPHAVIVKMMERNPALESYRARVHVNVRMLNFPFLAPKLDGTSFFKRPNTYEVVFDRVPGYAKGFERLFDDVGDPAVWEKEQNVSVDGIRQLDGRPAIVLCLRKKIRSAILDRTLAYIDPQSYALLQMEWYYANGGKITMVQSYRSEGGFSVLAAQHATIDIPHVRAIADATYGSYQTNLAFTAADSVSK